MPPILRTRRLVLRPFRRDDVDDVFDYATDPEWACYLPVPRPYTWLNAEEFVGAAVRADDRTRLGLGDHSRGASLGQHQSVDPRAWRGRDRLRHRSPPLGRGPRSEAAAAVVAFGFDALELECIEATADIRNAASWRVMEKLGTRREGAVPMNRSAQGERADGVRYTVQREEWRARERPGEG